MKPSYLCGCERVLFPTGRTLRSISAAFLSHSSTTWFTRSSFAQIVGRACSSDRSCHGPAGAAAEVNARSQSRAPRPGPLTTQPMMDSDMGVGECFSRSPASAPCR